MRWDEFEEEDYVDEVTEATEAAHRLAIDAADRQLTGYESVRGGAELRILVPATDETSAYVAIIRGQSSATGHGKQGAEPSRVASWRTLTTDGGETLSVWLCFVEPGQNVIWSGWLHLLAPARWIARDPARKRMGWRVSRDSVQTELLRAGRLIFPSGVPGAVREDLFGGAV